VIHMRAADRTRVAVQMRGVAAVGTGHRRAASGLAAVHSLRLVAAAAAVHKRVVVRIPAVVVHRQEQEQKVVVHKALEAVVRTMVGIRTMGGIRRKLQTTAVIAVAAPGVGLRNSCCRAAGLPAEGQERVHLHRAPDPW
jgi:hypothetical protein